MIVGLLERLDEQSRARLLAEAFEHSMIAKAVASLAPDAVGDIVEVNAAFCHLVGYERDELVGRPCGMLFDAADRAAVAAGLGVLARGERRELVIDRMLVRRDGARVWVTTRAVVAHDALGAGYVVTESVDSSHSHALADSEARAGALSHDQELLDAVVAATPDLLLVTTPEGRVVRANASWERTLGWSETDLQGMDVTTLIHPDDVAAAVATATAVAEADDGRPGGLRVRYRDRAGAYRWLQWHGAQLPGQGLLVAMGRDVTDAVAREEELRRSAADRTAALARAERETGRLRTTIAVQREVTATAGDRDAMLRLMAERALQVITAGDAAVVNLLDEHGTRLHPAAAAGDLDAAGRPQLPVAGSLAGLAIRAAATLRCDDTRADDRVASAVSAAVGVRSLIVAPLLAPGGPRGVLTVSSRAPGAVSVTPRASRWNRATPRWCSSVRIWWDTAVGVTRSSCAASLKLRSRAAASKVRRAFRGNRANTGLMAWR